MLLKHVVFPDNNFDDLARMANPTLSYNVKM